jgi:hypothetical protein
MEELDVDPHPATVRAANKFLLKRGKTNFMKLYDISALDVHATTSLQPSPADGALVNQRCGKKVHRSR